MKTLISIGFLAVLALIAAFVDVYILNIAGLPGALIGGKPHKDFSIRWVIGLLVAVIGQAYVYLAYVAFVVNWADLAITNQGVNPIILWPITFLAVMVPIGNASLSAVSEAKDDGYLHLHHTQLDAVSWTTFIALIGFFIFVFAPGIMHAIYSWVPYI